MSSCPFNLVTYLCSVETTTLWVTTAVVGNAIYQSRQRLAISITVTVMRIPLVIGLRKVLNWASRPQWCVRKLLNQLAIVVMQKTSVVVNGDQAIGRQKINIKNGTRTIWNSASNAGTPNRTTMGNHSPLARPFSRRHRDTNALMIRRLPSLDSVKHLVSP